MKESVASLAPSYRPKDVLPNTSVPLLPSAYSHAMRHQCQGSEAEVAHQSLGLKLVLILFCKKVKYL